MLWFLKNSTVSLRSLKYIINFGFVKALYDNFLKINALWHLSRIFQKNGVCQFKFSGRVVLRPSANFSCGMLNGLIGFMRFLSQFGFSGSFCLQPRDDIDI